MPAEPAARRVTLVAVFALAAGMVALAIALLATKKTPGLLATNGADESTFVAVISDRAYCQRGEVVPAGTAAVRMLIGTYGQPGPPLRAEIRSPGRTGRTIARGRLAPGWSQGHVTVPVGRVGGTMPASVCVQTGGGARVALAGQRTFDRRRQVVRIEYLDAKRENHLARLPETADYYGRGKSRWLGSWTLGLTGLLALAAIALAGRRMLVEGRP